MVGENRQEKSPGEHEAGRPADGATAILRLDLLRTYRNPGFRAIYRPAWSFLPPPFRRRWLTANWPVCIPLTAFMPRCWP